MQSASPLSPCFDGTSRGCQGQNPLPLPPRHRHSQGSLSTPLHGCAILFGGEVPGATKAGQQAAVPRKRFLELTGGARNTLLNHGQERPERGLVLPEQHSGWERRVRAQRATACPGRACEGPREATGVGADICNTYVRSTLCKPGHERH